MTKLNQDQIDNYHAGRMSESEMTDFENMLEADPSIKAESDLQAEIIEGLKEYRKLELKSRLDAINVGPTWIEFAQQSTLMKSLGGVMVASIIGTGIYFYGERPSEIISDEPATVEALESESIEFVWELGNEDEPQITENLEEAKQKKSETDVEVVEKPVSEKEKTQDVILKEEVAKVEASKVFKPTFEAPNAESVEDESKFATTGLDEIPDNADGVDAERPIDVKSEVTKSKVIKYKYYDGKLFLNGDFDKAPYEILEINSASGRRIYVYHLGNYYRVGIADKLTELPLVTNAEVINELKLLRENK